MLTAAPAGAQMLRSTQTPTIADRIFRPPVRQRDSGVVATVAMLCDPRRQPFVDDFRSFPKGCRRRPWHRSLFTGGVFLAAQRTVMIQIASGEVLAEPLVALDVILSQLASLCGIQGIEVWARGGFPHGAVSRIVVRAHRTRLI